jgi:hypothetical protein
VCLHGEHQKAGGDDLTLGGFLENNLFRLQVGAVWLLRRADHAIALGKARRILQGEYEVKRPLSSEVKILATSIALLDV